MITIVSGLPRSGTSLMMQMLLAGGMQVLSDGQRRADADNPRGYLEWGEIKQLPKDSGIIGSRRQSSEGHLSAFAFLAGETRIPDPVHATATPGSVLAQREMEKWAFSVSVDSAPVRLLFS